MPDSRKPPRQPPPPPRKRVPESPPRRDSTGEISLSGAIELDPDEISRPLTLVPPPPPRPSKLTPPPSIEEVVPEPVPAPIAVPITDERPRRVTPPPPPQRQRTPEPTAQRQHRIGIDATLPSARRGASVAREPTVPLPRGQEPQMVPAVINVGPAGPIAPVSAPVMPPAPPRPQSLFHESVVEEHSAPIVTITSPTPKPESVWADEVTILEREIAALRSTEPTRAALLLGALAAVQLGARDDRPAARRSIEAALGMSDERYALYYARRDAMAERAFGRAIELARKELGRIVEPKERLALLLQLGVLEERPGDSADSAASVRAFEAARELDPRHDTPLLALADLYLDHKEWQKLVGVYHALADGTNEPALRGMFRHAAGTIEERALSQNDVARTTYRAALAEDPGNLPAAEALSSLALRLEDWGELAQALETEADRLQDATTQKRLYQRAGDLYWERLSDADAASTAYRKAALAVPDAPEPLRRLAAVLESIGRWHELVDVLFAELPLCTTPQERASSHYLVGEINENHLDKPEDALTAYQAALSEVPDHVASLQALGGLYARQRRLDAVMQAELGEAERIAEPARRAARYLHLGDIAAHVLDDEDEAVRLYERCVELAPELRAASQGLEAIYRKRRAHDKLGALYEHQAEATDEPAFRRLYLTSAASHLLEADRATQPPRSLSHAEKLLRTAQALDAQDVLPSYALADALEDAAQWEALVGALGQLRERVMSKAERIALCHRAARVLELRIGADARALAVYEQILAIEPTHEAALLALVRLHQRAGKSTQEIEALVRLRERAPQPGDAAALSYRIARIYERRLGEVDAALLAYEDALSRKSDFAPALRALERLLRRDRRWPRLVEIYERRLSTARGAELAALHHAIGQIAELHLRDLPRADAAYVAALKAHPAHDSAGAALAHVREARGDHAGLAQLLEEQRPHVREPSALVAHLSRQAALAEGPLDDSARAATLYAQALEQGALGGRLHAAVIRTTRKHSGLVAATGKLRAFADVVTEPRLKEGARLLVALREESLPGGAKGDAFAALQSHAAAALDGKLRHAEPSALASLLNDRAKLADSAALRALLHLEAATRFDRDGHPRDAGQALEAADHAVNDLIPVLRGVRRMAAQSEQWKAAVVLYAHEAELSRDPLNFADALVHAGTLSLERLNDPRQAVDHFRRLLSRQPLHQLAFESSQSVLERSKDWAGIAALWKQRAEALTDNAARGEAWRRKAEVERDRLRDVPAALASLRASLEAAPDEIESWKAIAPLQEHQRFWQDAIETYKKISDLSRGDALGRAARLRESDLREHELGDREGARSILAELVVDPSDRDAQRRMATLCERMSLWDEARAMWTKLADTRSTVERADALVSLGHVGEASGEPITAALAAYTEALRGAFTTAEVATRLEARFREERALPMFVAAAEQALATASDQTQTLALRTVIARVYLHDLRDTEHAEAQLQMCTELAPDDASTFRALGQLLVDTRRPEQALPLLHRALDLEPSSPATLRALGAGLGHTGLRDAPRIFESAAAHIEGSPQPEPVPPLTVRRPLLAAEWATYFPREGGAGQVALSELAHVVEPFVPQLVAELTGERPRGEPLSGAAEAIARAAFHALGVTPLRLYVDTELGPEVLLCADDALAMLVGPALLERRQGPRLAFEVARLATWIAQGETIGAVLRGRALSSFIDAACDERGDDEVKETRRRIGKALPRKTRKEIERYKIPLADTVVIAGIWERSGYAASEELALLVCRDAAVVFDSLGYLPGESLPPNSHGTETLRFLASEDCWRAYRRLSDG